jgi:Undecaprenyl-phosphate glucose phosphotransferase
MMLIGTPREIRECTDQIVQRHAHMNLLVTETLPGDLSLHEEALQPMIAESTVRARSLSIDDVIIAIPWQRDGLIQSIVAQFADLPVSVHVACTRFFRAAPNLQVSQFSHLRTITLVSVPLSPLQLIIKRVMDVAIAGTALVLLAPLFLTIGVLIKVSSPGPVFFRQRRGGYNLAEFRIWKFRTMSTLDDGDQIVQAQRNDERLTRIGGFLRRYNLDELPQLINVLKGEMSIVGPRPHALAHDKEATRKIEAYSRRLNVRPGITGWAQVNGLRGPTKTVDLMQARVAHDLYYIENWSLGFDLYILFLTVFSPRAYTNSL